jgi:hypothetical protein
MNQSLDLSFMLGKSLACRANFKTEILDAIRSFSHIILRGAGSRGREIYYLLHQSVGVEKQSMCYWDIHADVYHGCHEIPVLPLFSGEWDPQKTLVIHCIGDAIPYDEHEYTSKGYSNVLNGNLLYDLYNKFHCPFFKGVGRDFRLCQGNERCRFFCCPKLDPALWHYAPLRDIDPAQALIANTIGLSVGTMCTIKCKHCCEYINHYAPEERINYAVERIKQDIDLISSTHDFIRSLSIEGGEFFLHPARAEIIMHGLSKPNVGLVVVLTNGVVKISPRDLAVMANERCVVWVSDYRQQLNEKQKALVDSNVRKLDEQGITWFYQR